MASAQGTFAKLIGIGRRADPAFLRRLAILALFASIAAVLELAALGSLLPLLAALNGGKPAAPSLPEPIPNEPLSLVLLFAALVLTAAIARLALTAAIQRGVLQLGRAITSAIQRRLLAQPYLFHASANSSRFVAALHKSDQLTLGLLRPLIQGFAGTIIGGAILGFLLATIGWKITLGAGAVFAGAYYVLSRIAGARLVERGGEASRAQEEQVRLLMESSGAIRDILLDHRQALFAEAFDQAGRRLAEARAGTDYLSQAPRFLIEAFGAIALAALAVAIAAREGGIAASLPLFALLALAMVRVLPLAQTAYRGWTMLAAARHAVDDVAELLDLPVEAADWRQAEPLGLGQGIAFENVGFIYPGAAGPVLADVSFAIRAGEWIGLTGPTGGGKSTLGDLLMGLVPPASGSILVDGQALTAPLVQRWQRSIGHVSQSVYLLDDSIAANIALAPGGADLDRERVATCARIAQLDEWTGGLASGLDSVVGERGQRLSGGQRQRIGIARALYKGAPLLLLDEATNALDLATEARLLDAIRAERPGITVLLISHRPTTLERCDRVLRVEGGRVTPA